MISILMIVLDSEAYEPEDVSEAIPKVWARAQCGDDDFFRGKRFEDAQAFLQKLPLLSGILIVGRWDQLNQPTGRNYLWQNPGAAMCLPQELGCLLQEL